MPQLKIIETEDGSFPAQELKVSSAARIKTHDGTSKDYNLNVAVAVITIISEADDMTIFDMELRDETRFRGEAPKPWVQKRLRYQHGHGILPASYSFSPKPIEGSEERQKLIGGAITGVIALVGLIIWMAHGESSPTDSAASSLRSDAVVYCKQAVKAALKVPKTADFPWAIDATPIGDDEFVVTSYVDAQNSFGAMIRTQYACQVKHIGGDQWKIQDLRTF